MKHLYLVFLLSATLFYLILFISNYYSVTNPILVILPASVILLFDIYLIRLRNDISATVSTSFWPMIFLYLTFFSSLPRITPFPIITMMGWCFITLIRIVMQIIRGIVRLN